MCAAMDLMITYMAAVPFNNNNIFMKLLNSIAIIIGLNKTKQHDYLKYTEITTDQLLI